VFRGPKLENIGMKTCDDDVPIYLIFPACVANSSFTHPHRSNESHSRDVSILTGRIPWWFTLSSDSDSALTIREPSGLEVLFEDGT
jgi:hypothetical protein